MSRLAQLMGGLALLAICTGAAARMHQICFEGPPHLQGGGFVPTAIFGCAIDGPGVCTIAAKKSYKEITTLRPLSLGVQSPGTFAYFEAPGSTPVTAMITFVDNGATVTRSCTVNPTGRTTPQGHATPGAVLTGFSTDASGLATTGVWKLQAATDAGAHDLALNTPADFVAVGGGAIGTDSPVGALIVHSQRGWGLTRNWRAGTAQGGGAAQLHRGTAFVIGLRIEGLTPQALEQLLVPSGSTGPATAESSSIANGNFASAPADHVLAPSSGVVIGGGFVAAPFVLYPPFGQFGTASAPFGDGYEQCDFVPNGGFDCHFVVLNATGWRSGSKDHIIAAPGLVGTQVMALPPTITVGGIVFRVQSKVVTAISGVAPHPAVDVSGLRGEFALTGIGAAVNWRRIDPYGNQLAAGNLLWKLEPRADLGGASVASKDHILSSPASITGYALGIKLVP